MLPKNVWPWVSSFFPWSPTVPSPDVKYVTSELNNSPVRRSRQVNNARIIIRIASSMRLRRELFTAPSNLVYGVEMKAAYPGDC